MRTKFDLLNIGDFFICRYSHNLCRKIDPMSTSLVKYDKAYNAFDYRENKPVIFSREEEVEYIQLSLMEKISFYYRRLFVKRKAVPFIIFTLISFFLTISFTFKYGNDQNAFPIWFGYIIQSFLGIVFIIW